MSELESVHKKSCYDSVEQSKEFSERDCFKVMGILFSTSAYCTIKSQANDLEIIKPASYKDLKTEIYAQERMETHMRSNSSKRKSAITSESNVQTTLNTDQVQRFKFCNKTGQCWHKKSSINALNGNQQRMVNPANFTQGKIWERQTNAQTTDEELATPRARSGHIGLVDALNSKDYDDAHW
jgi:hypothetical protein